MPSPTNKELKKEDERFFEFLEERDSRTYRASPENNLLTKDLRHPKEDRDYQLITSGNSSSTQSPSTQSPESENAELE